MTVEVFLDEQPGETRGVIARDGRFEHLLIQREADPAQHRLGARSIGRVEAGEAGLNGVFVDLGVEVWGFLPLKPGERISEGEKIEVEVTAEPRHRKGPVLKRIGPGSGEPRLTRPGPDVKAELARLAPGIEPVTGLAAIQASWDAEEEAGFPGVMMEGSGVDVMVERTRALIAVDLDLASSGGRDIRRARDRANAEGLIEAARIIRLKGWAGLVAIDLIGARHDGEAMTALARKAFGDDPDIAYGPVSKFGLMQLALPWRRTPIEDVLNDWDGRPSLEARAAAIVRSLRHAMLSDTTIPRFTARAAPDEAEAAAAHVQSLGPRVAVKADPALAAGRFELEEG